MENNNEIMNEEAIETTEEIVKASSGCGFKKAAGIGLAMIAGGLVCKFVVEPGVARFKAWRKMRKTIPPVGDNYEEDDFEADIVEDSEE